MKLLIISKKIANAMMSIYMNIYFLKQVKASSDIFGDPCEGVAKYLEAEYQCQGI